MCPWGKGTGKQKWWRQGSSGQQDIHSLPQMRCWPGRRNYRKERRKVSEFWVTLRMLEMATWVAFHTDSGVITLWGCSPALCSALTEGLGLEKVNGLNGR